MQQLVKLNFSPSFEKGPLQVTLDQRMREFDCPLHICRSSLKVELGLREFMANYNLACLTFWILKIFINIQVNRLHYL